MKSAISPTGGLATGGTPSTVRAAAATGGLGVRLSTTVIGTARAGGFIGPAPQLRQDSTARDGWLASADWYARHARSVVTRAARGLPRFTNSQHYEDVDGRDKPGHDAEHVALFERNRLLVLQRSIRPPRASGHSVFLRDHRMSHEVTDEFDLIDIVIKQFNAGRFFDRDHQLKSLQPIKSEIFHEVRLIRDARGIDP
jgi:hypothetical protein